jgi:glycosyltransferase involved in cell wall biosynthesis
VFEPPDGGVAENVMRLAMGLGDRGWEVSVAGPERAVTYRPLAEAGIPVERLPLERGYGHPLRDARALRRLAGVMRRGRYDLTHAHSAKAGVLGRLAAAATRTPAVYSPHCFPFVGPWGLPRRAFSTGVERALAPLTRKILCVADQERSLALEKHVGRAEKLVVVHNGSEPCEEGLDPDPELAAFATEGPLAACITALRPQKAVHVLVEAAPAVLERVPEARLAVIGNGELRGELEARAAELAVSPQLRFFDFHAPAARQLRSLDVFVLPSAWEAFPISVLEALACGVPQVATDVGGTSEAVGEGETGLLCPPNDPAALADRIVELLRDPGRRERMAAASRQRHRERFLLERMIDETAAVYEGVVAEARG